MRLSGRAASMSRGIVEDVSRRMLDTFAHNLAESLGGPGPQAETETERPAPPPPPEAPAPPPKPRDEHLDVGGLAGDIAADRLREPRTLALALGLAATRPRR